MVHHVRTSYFQLQLHRLRLEYQRISILLDRKGVLDPEVMI